MNAELPSPAVLGRLLEAASALVEEQPRDDFRDEALAPWATALGNALAAKLDETGTETKGPLHPEVVARWLERTAGMVGGQPAERFTESEITDAAISLCELLLDKLRGTIRTGGGARLHLVEAPQSV